MMLELHKEIELEHANSEIHNFLNVSVTDKNLEKRGDGRRMVFHCQRMNALLSFPFFFRWFVCFFFNSVDLSGGPQRLLDGHIVLGRIEYSRKKVEFLAIITYVSLVKKTGKVENAIGQSRYKIQHQKLFPTIL